MEDWSGDTSDCKPSVKKTTGHASCYKHLQQQHRQICPFRDNRCDLSFSSHDFPVGFLNKLFILVIITTQEAQRWLLLFIIFCLITTPTNSLLLSLPPYFILHINSESLSLHRCSRKDRCHRAEETFRFATDIDRCVKVIAHPDSIAVSAHSVPVSPLIIPPITASPPYSPCQRLRAITKSSLVHTRSTSSAEVMSFWKGEGGGEQRFFLYGVHFYIFGLKPLDCGLEKSGSCSSEPLCLHLIHQLEG